MARAPSRSRPNSAALARLRAEVARLEGMGTQMDEAAPVVALGCDAVDRHLPGGGIGRGQVHEIVAGDHGAAALGVALWFVSRLCTGAPWLSCAAMPWLWCTRELPYGPALADFGLAPETLIVARCRKARELLWAAEEGLAAPALGAVLVEAAAIDATAARRLALASRQSGVGAVLLRPEGPAAPLATATRWRVTGAPDGAWDVELARARGATGRRWRLAWHGRDGARPVTLLCDGDPHDQSDKQPTRTPQHGGQAAGTRPVAAAPAGGAA